MKRNRLHARAAFTLTEVLVVCIIIGILMSLVANAVFSAIGTAKEAAITNEIDKMRIAMDQFKTDVGQIPPADLRNPDLASSPVYKFFAVAFPNYDIATPQAGGTTRLEEDLQAEGINYQDYDPGYALVFWLVGFNPDSHNPLRGHGRRMGWDPEWAAGDPGDSAELEADLTNAFYEFERDRLVRGHYFPPFTKGDLDRYYSHADTDGNGIWEFSEEFDGHNAYLYFDADSSYKGLLDNDPAAPLANQVTVFRGFMPYRKLAEMPVGLPVTTGFSKLRADRDPHYNNDTYQIVSAGLDEKLGSGGRPPAEDEAYSGPDTDNITNFSQGTMGDFTDK
jgi:prepilin-type N-terminal cleavage/methylation domain-containing protein